uniref:3-hydroxyacyl-CoA dehydrogenase n=1 Tax=uncultured Rhizobium sp. HF0130_09F11 TaxID=723625 RepID=E7C2J3_9HYPH|nr:3-hydroxyacyl-CoA dehydrogenase [uncultured Rhizobium sp. HF0130_09F11]
MSGVAIVGAGTMGRAIAAGFARSGERTLLVSRDPAGADPAPAGVDLVGALPDEPPAMVVEAIPEDMALKTAFFRSVEARYKPDSVPLMASNTSGLPLQDIADRLARPDLFLGIHWFHPADELPMVESVRVAQTAPATVDTALALLRAAGWDSIVVPRPVPGAVVNRLQHAILHEAYHLMGRGAGERRGHRPGGALAAGAPHVHRRAPETEGSRRSHRPYPGAAQHRAGPLPRCRTQRGGSGDAGARRDRRAGRPRLLRLGRARRRAEIAAAAARLRRLIAHLDEPA